MSMTVMHANNLYLDFLDRIDWVEIRLNQRDKGDLITAFTLYEVPKMSKKRKRRFDFNGKILPQITVIGHLTASRLSRPSPENDDSSQMGLDDLQQSDEDIGSDSHFDADAAFAFENGEAARGFCYSNSNR
jgi:hypothetical protein